MRELSLEHRRRPQPLLQRIRFVAVTTAALALAGWGCEHERRGPGGASLRHRLAALTSDVGPGSAGEDVRAIQQYLQRYGYFPNDRLARSYPRWRPIVNKEPAWGSYDGHTRAAIRALQRNLSLPVSGVVDAATRAQLRQHRCGVPDNIAPLDKRDKFAIHSAAWGSTNLTWRIDDFFGIVDRATARNRIIDILARVSRVTNLTFTEVTSGNATMIFRTEPLLDEIAVASLPTSSDGNIYFNDGLFWTTDTPPPSGEMDFEAVAVHMVGHRLGLLHSSLGGQGVTAMHQMNEITRLRWFGEDDRRALSILYNPWQNVSGCAKDIGANANGHVWIVGCDDTLWRTTNNGNSWTKDTRAIPVNPANIAVAKNNSPWLLQSNGNIWRRSSSDPNAGSWHLIPGCAQDIGAGHADVNHPNSGVWVVGCPISGEGRLHHFNGSIFVPDSAQRNGKRVSVDGVGRPFVVNAAGEYHYKNHNIPNDGVWVRLQNDFVATGGDIGAMGANPFFIDHFFLDLWITTQSPAATWQWNEQPFENVAVPDTDGDPDAPLRNGWQWEDGIFKRVAASPCGPWLIAADGKLYRRLKCQQNT